MVSRPANIGLSHYIGMWTWHSIRITANDLLLSKAELPAFVCDPECNSNVCRTDGEADLLTTRQQVRQAILQGRIQDAQTLLHDNHADMLESVLHPNLDVVIFFHCLQYIELIR